MRKVWAGLLGLTLFLPACAELIKAAPAFVGKFLTISMDPVVSFPPEATLEGFDGGGAGATGSVLGTVFHAVTGESLKEKVGALIASNAEPYTVSLTRAFKDEIIRRDLYQGVVEQGGNVQMRLSVARYGLKAIQGIRSMKPLLDVKAELLLPGFGVVWSQTHAVDENSLKTLALSATRVLAGQASFQEAFDSAGSEAAAAIVAELK